MTTYSTTVRATHLLTNAAWFGGALMRAIALNPATRDGTDARERARVVDTRWARWAPVQGTAVGLHLLSGVGILLDNRHRVLAHQPTTAAVVLKTALTGAAVAASAAASRSGAELSTALAHTDEDAAARRRARSLGERMSWLQWVAPATTAGLLVIDAYLGEQQRGVAGLLDRPSAPLGQS